ncbi:MAG: alpha/beta fold hydrolase [Marivibrio sp.]|uniref:alpha/beta hydrolase n=1 Tax=Marivibrio sp. TaxID=2039719 RepID=UPI0032EF67AB
MPEGSQPLALEVLRARPPEGVAARKTPVLMLHGAFAGAWCFGETWLQRFAEAGYEASAFSFRGHGDSAGRDRLDRFGVEDYVRDLDAMIKDQPAPPILVAHSMGGFVAMRYLERAFARGAAPPVAGLSLLASVPPAGLWGPSLSLMTFQPTLFFELAMIQGGQPSWMSLDSVNRALFTPETPKEAAHAYYARLTTESRRAVLDMQGGVRIDASRIAGRLPIQVLGADHDVLIPPAFVRATGRSLGVTAEILSGVGHGMMLGRTSEKPARRVLEWLARVAS